MFSAQSLSTSLLRFLQRVAAARCKVSLGLCAPQGQNRPVVPTAGVNNNPGSELVAEKAAESIRNTGHQDPAIDSMVAGGVLPDRIEETAHK